MIELPTESEPLKVIDGDCRIKLKEIAGPIDLVFTSPPYFAQRDYGDAPGEIGKEDRPQCYLRQIVEVIELCYQRLDKSGHILVNLGDKYNADGPVKNATVKAGEFNGAKRQARWPGMSLKSLMMLPARLAIACVDDIGLALRGEIVWSQDAGGSDGKASDRVRRSHEIIYHFTPSRKHGEASGVWDCPGGSVWDIAPDSGGDHTADFPVSLARRVIRCWCPPGGMVVDPFGGSGTVAVAAALEGRRCILIEKEPAYAEIARKRIAQVLSVGMFEGIEESPS